MSAPTTVLDAATTFPDEVVTRTLVRDVSLPGGTFALVTLDNGFDHTKPNTFGPADPHRARGGAGPAAPAGRGRRDHRRRDHRQAVHLRRRRRPDRRARR